MPATRAKLAETPPESPIITRAEKKQVEERVAIGANVVYETIRREGEDEMQRNSGALGFSARSMSIPRHNGAVVN
jgi:hypothetical protein